MTTDDRKLVLVVDADPGFVEEARTLVADQRTLSARDLSEAYEIVLGGRVDVVVLGPAFAAEHSVSEAAVLGRADASARIVLVADIVTNRLLKAALRDTCVIPLQVLGRRRVFARRRRGLRFIFSDTIRVSVCYICRGTLRAGCGFICR